MLIELEVARRLIDAQFPEFRHFALHPIESGGTDNTIFRLGDSFSVRFPKRAEAAEHIDTEKFWLPRLAALPVRIPKPQAKGAASSEFPYPWTIYDWCPGQALSETEVKDWAQAAKDISTFLQALQVMDTQDAPLSGPRNHFRGVPLKNRDALTRAAIHGLADEYPEPELLHHWHDALSATPHRESPVWLHGDLQGGNILVFEDRISAIIDFGLCGVGDPACDLMVAWSVLPKQVREPFRQQIACNEAAWARGRGWALSVSAIALEYYRDRNPHLSHISRQTLSAILTDG
ncbi:MAG: aminoglycoside phosphotransferase family protein [Pseudomonadota bacterium]